MTACTRCETALEDGDLRCAICALPVPAVAPDLARHAQVLRCRDCGAAVAFSGEARAPRCGFCGATMAIEQPIDPIETARRRLPFTVDRRAAEAALRCWLARRGWFAPAALSDEAVLESLTPLAWAAWQINAQARVTWTADSDAGAQRSAWAPHAGEASLAFRDIVVPASRGLRAAECRRLLPYYELAHAVAIDAPAQATIDATIDAKIDAKIEQFEALRSAARRSVQDAIEAAARVRIQPLIPGRRHRNIRVACLVERQRTERVVLPAWILAYRYRDRAYRALVHGQRPGVVFGRSPIDLRKVVRLVGLVVLIAVAIALFAFTR
jgi:hypothetical protein